MSEKVVILGAGIAGLTAGINLLQKGYDVTIVEKNDDVGGLCYGYVVKGHYIDVCLHWLMGTNKESTLYEEWCNIGAIDEDTKIISLPTLGSFEYEGTTVTFYRDLDKTEKELGKISPIDKRAIHKFICAAIDMGSIMGVLFKSTAFDYEDALHMLPNSGHLLMSMKQSREDYSYNFSHPAIRFAIKHAQTGYNNMFFYLDTYGLFSNGNADIPEGGAYYMVQRIKNKFLKLGGELLLNTNVEELVIEKEAVSYAKTDKGIINGDHFISSIDPQFTLKKLLGGKYKINLFDKLDSAIDKHSISSSVNVFITVEGDTSHIDVPTILHINPMKIGANEVDYMLVRPYHYDAKHFVKDGKTVVLLFIDQNQDDYDYLKSLSEEQYKLEVERITSSMINAFTNRYKEFEGKVELLEHVGPVELEKRSNTSYGSIQSYSFTNKGMFYVYNGKFNDIKNLYLCGQWNRAIGGTPTALLTAVEVCKLFEDKTKNEEDK